MVTSAGSADMATGSSGRPSSTGCHSCHGRAENASDIGFLATTDYHLAGLCQATNHQQDRFLFVLDRRHTHRATVGKIVAQNICCTCRHVFEELLAQRLLCTFQGDQQLLGLHFLQQTLDTAIVHFHQIFEQEHLVDDFLCQLAVEVANRFDDRFFLLRFHQVDDFCRRSYAAHLRALEVGAVEQAVQHFGQFCQCGRLYATKGRNTQHDVMTQAFIKQRQDICSLTAFEVYQNGRDNLGMLVANKVGSRLRLHEVERFHPAGGITGFKDILQQA
ncbi:hypothetical protein PAJ_1608 [Pantoea ananatis AJ13355]|uniref:Uncharacterized protein n=1 Tax=Pantoea ananatis (strain AJ13355) TaxID=932677 RepID=A0A0H3KX75_PANAA|nr:hypothetical protein PAJ_1608 [Pantoea ananatis AJ13355]